MLKKAFRIVFSCLFFLLGTALTAFTLWLSFGQLDSQPVLLETPDSAIEQVEGLMSALCSGDYGTAGTYLYGAPELQADLEGDTAQALWNAYVDSLQYTIISDCYASDSGLAVDLELQFLDLDSVTGSLHDRCQAMLNAAAENAEDPDRIYGADGQYRQELIMDIFGQALALALKEDAVYRQEPLTLHLTRENDCWYVTPEDALLHILSGNI